MGITLLKMLFKEISGHIGLLDSWLQLVIAAGGFGIVTSLFIMDMTSYNDLSPKYLIYISSKPKIDACILFTPASALLLRFI